MAEIIKVFKEHISAIKFIGKKYSELLDIWKRKRCT